MANARLGWFSPLGLAASIRASARRVGLRAHCFRFSACAASELPLGEFVLPPSASEIALGGLGFGLTASAFRPAPFRSGHWASWPSGSRLPLFGMHRFGVALGGLVLPLGGLAFGLTASAFRHVPLRSGRWASWFFRLPLRKLPSAGWPSGSLLPLFGMRRFGVTLGGLVLPLGGLAFGLTASAFRHAPLRSGRWAVGLRAYCFGDCHLAGWPLGSPLRKFGSAGWPSGSLLPLFGTHRFGVAAGRVRSSAFRFGVAVRRVCLRAHGFRFSACTDPHRRAAEARTDGAQRHDNCFTSKHLSQHVNLPHRTP